jgi:hypothetical protein
LAQFCHPDIKSAFNLPLPARRFADSNAQRPQNLQNLETSFHAGISGEFIT